MSVLTNQHLFEVAYHLTDTEGAITSGAVDVIAPDLVAAIECGTDAITVPTGSTLFVHSAFARGDSERIVCMAPEPM